MMPKPSTQLRLGKDGSVVKCGSCRTPIGRAFPVAGSSDALTIRLQDGYTKPDLARYHYAPTDQAKRDYRAAQQAASGRDPDALRALKEMTTLGWTKPTAESRTTQRNYLHEARLRPLVRDFIVRKGSGVTVECIACGLVNGTEHLVN
jgi:hypothetical protein